jgi:hypothetical protein
MAEPNGLSFTQSRTTANARLAESSVIVRMEFGFRHSEHRVAQFRIHDSLELPEVKTDSGKLA